MFQRAGPSNVKITQGRGQKMFSRPIKIVTWEIPQKRTKVGSTSLTFNMTLVTAQENAEFISPNLQNSSKAKL